MTGAILRRLREAYGFTRTQVAKMSGLHPGAVASMERFGISAASDARHWGRKSRTWRAYIAGLRRLRARAKNLGKRK